MKLAQKLLSVSLLVFVLCGCVEKEILDDITLVDGFGFDYIDKDKIEGTVLFSVYLPDQPPKNKTFSAEAEIKKTILQDVGRQSSEPIVTGSIEVILFGEELARKEGILELIDAFQRDPGVGSGLYMAVVDGRARELLEGEYGIRGNAPHISKLIEHNITEEDMPKTNLQRFLFDYYQEGKTPFMPQLKQIAKDKAVLSGISFFKYGKTVDFIIPEKMFFFKLLVDKYSEGSQAVQIKEGKASIRNIRSVHSFELSKQNPLEVTIHVDVQGNIEEFTGNVLTPSNINDLQKQFEKDISEESMNLIKGFQEKQIDPIGFGHFIKTQTKHFDIKKWSESGYKDLTVNIKPKVTITESGVIE